MLAKIYIWNKKSCWYTIPTKNPYQILCGLLRHSWKHHSNPPNFLDRKDTLFIKLHNTCDSVFHLLHKQGVVANKISTKVTTKVDQDKWKLNILSCMKAVFFTLESMLLARAGGAKELQAIIIFQIEEFWSIYMCRVWLQEQEWGIFHVDSKFIFQYLKIRCCKYYL